eukprot:2803987-Pleurochrysis_carterae.AAC.1
MRACACAHSRAHRCASAAVCARAPVPSRRSANAARFGLWRRPLLPGVRAKRAAWGLGVAALPGLSSTTPAGFMLACRDAEHKGTLPYTRHLMRVLQGKWSDCTFEGRARVRACAVNFSHRLAAPRFQPRPQFRILSGHLLCRIYDLIYSLRSCWQWR